MAKKEANNKVFYKKWWFWLIVLAVFICIGAMNTSKQNGDGGNEPSQAANTTDYTNKDAKQAYDELLEAGYEVKFMFDRNNNGGFTEDNFQEYILDSFSSESYTEMPFIVTRQSADSSKVTLYVEYASAIEADQAQKARQEALEAKLGIVEAMTACEQYGKQNYRDFDMHSILGKIAENASDDDTWFLKYTVDADGYEDLTMECYVTGTSDNPVVKQYNVY